MHPDKNVAMSDHQYGTCVHKLFSTFKDGLDTKFKDHQDSIINFQNDETNMNAELMSNFATSYENHISGTVEIIPFYFDASMMMQHHRVYITILHAALCVTYNMQHIICILRIYHILRTYNFYSTCF